MVKADDRFTFSKVPRYAKITMIIAPTTIPVQIRAAFLRLLFTNKKTTIFYLTAAEQGISNILREVGSTCSLEFRYASISTCACMYIMQLTMK